MKKIGFVTLGCKVNIYESNALKNELIKKGYEVGEPTSFCDAFIVNTCSVTNMADAKSRRMIHRLAKLNPTAVLCVMGCYSQTNKEALEIEGVDIIVGNGNKLDVIPMLEEKLLDHSLEKKIELLDILNHKEYEPLEVTTYDHTRAFVKIEDGCENFCTYCIIPYARGPVRSKPADEVINEIKRIVNEGYLEVVLAGIHTGRYDDHGVHLSALIERILKEIPKLERLRLSSIEINEVDDAFIELMRNSKVLANHLHLPLQSGSDAVLEKMERKYNTAFFLEKIEKIRNVRPDISITTDVIVGFPYETEEEFITSIEFIKRVNFSKLHVFPYSMRKGTKACNFPQIQDSIKKNRTGKLLALSYELELNYANKFIGKTVEVIIEQIIDEQYMVGHSSNYLQVYLKKNEAYLKKNIKVKIEKMLSNKLYASIVFEG
ncbi:MAG: tRNA (N(6)-L-threonylcarbamoyladenosine(37)-C(2))-methylthiotransferase MtaB [Roseburia sp.]|nr:tRNA (N(6)-L-threonylcarbamoyladenosine(37)-C(2))-methylthiotransferase MtaB [Anaeroplasma bactoclasticum]MCM1197120.1 tRNA (N(6)-L-threonylcarbamoyladenosine(37)-C(2))-methylthiotransferase MtaB [Roseburia sp.]MCM1557550.1 tRNA (N(6)-L-threonylcarbamoyladenosine(37)-C(2))-methylthiotransferase MtaB [Anaeroplasma bactoclasticum]